MRENTSTYGYSCHPFTVFVRKRLKQSQVSLRQVLLNVIMDQIKLISFLFNLGMSNKDILRNTVIYDFVLKKIHY